PADRGVISRCAGQLGHDRIPRQLVGGDHLRREPRQPGFFFARGGGVDPLVDGGSEALLQRAIVLTRVPAGNGGDLRGEQGEENAVLVGRPDRAVAAEERSAGALLSPKADGAIEQAGNEPLESNRNLVQPATEILGYPVD